MLAGRGKRCPLGEARDARWERQDVLFVLRSAFEQLSNLLLFELLVRLGG